MTRLDKIFRNTIRNNPKEFSDLKNTVHEAIYGKNNLTKMGLNKLKQKYPSIEKIIVVDNEIYLRVKNHGIKRRNGRNYESKTVYAFKFTEKKDKGVYRIYIKSPPKLNKKKELDNIIKKYLKNSTRVFDDLNLNNKYGCNLPFKQLGYFLKHDIDSADFKVKKLEYCLN